MVPGGRLEHADEAVRNGEKLGPLHGVPLSIKSCD